MKIVDLATLRSLPQGTIYQKYAPCHFDDMSILDGPCGERDVVYCGFGSCPVDTDSDSDFIDKCTAMEAGASFPVSFDLYGRDGCFQDDQLFAIWEPSDVQALIAELQKGLAAQGIPTEGGDGEAGSVHG